MLSETQVEQFKKNGFVNGGRVLDDATVDILRDEMMRVIDNRDNAAATQPLLLRNLSGDENAPVWQIVNIWQASEPFHKLLGEEQIVSSIAQLMSASELRIWHDQIQYKPARIGGVNMWHQDSPYWPILTPMTEEITAWIALDDVGEDNGCMSMIPGSYLWGNQIDFLHTLKSYDDMPSEFEGHALETTLCPVKKGAVHFHHALTWHGSGANTSGRPRRAIALHYMTDKTRYKASGDHVMKPFVEVQDGEKLTGKAFPRVYPLNMAEVW